MLTANSITTQQAADELGVKRQWVTKLIQRGKLPAEKHGRDWSIKYADLALVRDLKPGRPPHNHK